MRRMFSCNRHSHRGRASDSFASSAKRRFRVPAWAVVFIAAIVLIVLGVAQGEMLDVWRKASLICYECIGIG